MAGFEDLIRDALNKQDDPSPQRRAAIYQSSRQALERMLGQNTKLNDVAITAQRDRLEQAIVKIESDYLAASSPPPKAPPQTPQAPKAQTRPPAAPAPNLAPKPAPQSSPQPAPVQAPVPAPVPASAPAVKQAAQKPAIRVEPGFEQPKVPEPQPPQSSQAPQSQQPRPPLESPHQLEPESLTDDGPVPPVNYGESYTGDALRERKPYARTLLWTIILVGLGVAIWWAINFGPALIKQQLDGSVPNPERSIESGSFLPDGGEGWVDVFKPREDAANIDSGGRGTADLFQDGNSNFIRLASNPGGSRNNLRIKVPRGVLVPLKGEAATFELVLRNNSEKAQQFAVFCEFGEMGNCGRKRFKISKKIEVLIFDVLVNDVLLPESEDAYIAINTDLGGNGKALDLFSIRVRTGS